MFILAFALTSSTSSLVCAVLDLVWLVVSRALCED